MLYANVLPFRLPRLDRSRSKKTRTSTYSQLTATHTLRHLLVFRCLNSKAGRNGGRSPFVEARTTTIFGPRSLRPSWNQGCAAFCCKLNKFQGAGLTIIDTH